MEIKVPEAYVTTDRNSARPVGMVPLTINIKNYTWTMMVPADEYREALNERNQEYAWQIVKGKYWEYLGYCLQLGYDDFHYGAAAFCYTGSIGNDGASYLTRMELSACVVRT